MNLHLGEPQADDGQCYRRGSLTHPSTRNQRQAGPHRIAHLGELSPAEKLSAYAWLFDLLKRGELAYSQYLSQDLDEPVWDPSLQSFMAYWTTPGMREYWQDRRHAFTPEFREAMDGWLDSEKGRLTRSDAMYSVVEKATGSPES